MNKRPVKRTRRSDARAGCDGKVRYASWHNASSVARHARRRYSSPRTAYRCRYCQGFHVGQPVED